LRARIVVRVIDQILREQLARSLAAYLLSPERLDAMIRPTLARLGLEPAEIDDIIHQAEDNLRAWQADGPGAPSPEPDPDDTPE
jgi:hypothetical protein